MKRILFIASHRFDRAPGQRFRFEQYFDFLEANGFACELSFLLDEKKDRTLYSPGKLVRKSRIAISSWKKRLADVRRLEEFDAVFIFREALLSRSTFFEKAVRKRGIPLVIDFDDAIWIRDVSKANRAIRWAKDPQKISRILPLATEVTVGNEFLASYARGFNANINIIPSTIDHDFHRPLDRIHDKVCVGWSGSHTTIAHFDTSAPILRRLRERYGESIDLLTIGGKSEFAGELNIKDIPWSASEENEQLNMLDIGTMPLPLDDWSRGKCGMKALLYMATGCPVVASPVGANKKIITDGTTGFLPGNEDQWHDVLCQLIDQEELRKKIGNAGREVALNRYSKAVWSEKYLELFQRICS